MKLVSRNSAQRKPQPSHRRPSEEIPASAVFEFPILVNQFNVLQALEPAMSTSQEQIQDRLIDPRRTRLTRLQAIRGTNG